MMARNLIPYSVLALVVGSLVAAVPLQNNFSLLEKYEIDAEFVYVYLNIFDVNQNASGLRGLRMVSYVIVLKVMNPNDKVIRMRDVDIVLAEYAERHQSGVSMQNSLVACYRYLPQDHISYFWYPNNSKLVIFSGVRAFPDYARLPLISGAAFYSVLEIRGRTPEGAYASSGFVIKRIQLQALSPSEYVYDTEFGARRFQYGEDGVDLVIEWSNRTVSP